MIPTTITLTLDDKSIETINRLISALEKVSPTSVAPVQPITQVAPAAAAPSSPLVAASTKPAVSTAAPVPTAQQPVVQSPVTEVQQSAAIPTSHVAQSYTVEQLQMAMAPLVDAGKMEEIRALLNSFGVPSIMDLQPDQYGALATALRGMGAQI